MKRWKPYPHLLRKATLEEMIAAVDTLPWEKALCSDVDRKAYKKSYYRTLWMMGWEWQEFLDDLSQSMIEKKDGTY